MVNCLGKKQHCWEVAPILKEIPWKFVRIVRAGELSRKLCPTSCSALFWQHVSVKRYREGVAVGEICKKLFEIVDKNVQDSKVFEDVLSRICAVFL